MTNDSPMTDEETEWDEDSVFELCCARMIMTEEEWANDRHDWDISREEAATRVAERDFSPPPWAHVVDDDEDEDEEDEVDEDSAEGKST